MISGIATTQQTLCRVTIRMGDREWGNVIMERLAREWFAANPYQSRRTVVNVIEHAGWFLTYATDSDGLFIVGTANDSARLSDRAMAFRESFQDAETVHMPTVHRQELIDSGLITALTD